MMTDREEMPDRRAQTQQMIEKWLRERQEMLVLYCQLAGLEPYTPDKPIKGLLRDFCQVLVDYIAFGHFEVYDRISRGEERRTRVLRVAEDVYPKVVAVTDLAVAFNDKYETEEKAAELDELDQDLSRLGSELASRIEMEDQLVNALIGSNTGTRYEVLGTR
jgi:regulator of sigma D